MTFKAQSLEIKVKEMEMEIKWLRTLVSKNMRSKTLKEVYNDNGYIFTLGEEKSNEVKNEDENDHKKDDKEGHNNKNEKKNDDKKKDSDSSTTKNNGQDDQDNKKKLVTISDSVKNYTQCCCMYNSKGKIKKTCGENGTIGNCKCGGIGYCLMNVQLNRNRQAIRPRSLNNSSTLVPHTQNGSLVNNGLPNTTTSVTPSDYQNSTTSTPKNINSSLTSTTTVSTPSSSSIPLSLPINSSTATSLLQNQVIKPIQLNLKPKTPLIQPKPTTFTSSINDSILKNHISEKRINKSQEKSIKTKNKSKKQGKNSVDLSTSPPTSTSTSTTTMNKNKNTKKNSNMNKTTSKNKLKGTKQNPNPMTTTSSSTSISTTTMNLNSNVIVRNTEIHINN